VAVFVDGATKADMHETSGEAMKPLKGVDLAPSETVTFAPGGKHVMLSGIPGTWKPGDDPDVTLTFADGDKISAKAAVEKSRSADELDARSGMKM
jgi:copper(I)-binding protein